ncbi:MAG: HAD-IA family hydrolase [Bacillota bacterium]|nr:HAD-IA family hydrolase [Bacillota bacterium]
MPRFSTVLFDLDGTLIDTNELILRSFAYTSQVHLGRPWTKEELLPHFGLPLREQLQLLAPGRVEELLTTYSRFNEVEHDRLARPVPQARRVLSALQRSGIKLGVVTSKRRHLAERALRHFRLWPYFQAVVCCEDTERHKPYPEPVLLALERLEARAADTLFLGDTPCDLLAGKAAGVQTAAVSWSLLPREQLATWEPDFWLSRLTDLLPLCC